jgi:hypothetical protein
VNNKLYIIFSTADWNSKYLTNKQHLAHGLSKEKNSNVLYIESFGLRKPKLKSLTDCKRIIKRLFTQKTQQLKNDQINISIYKPKIFPISLSNKVLNILNIYLISTYINKFLKKNIYTEIIVWSFHPFYVEQIVNKLKKDIDKVVYNSVDDLSAIKGINKNHYLAAENMFISYADIIFVTNKEIYERLKPFSNEIKYYPNVADLSHFSSPTSIFNWKNDIKFPAFVYHGVFSELKLDFKFLINFFLKNSKYYLYLIGDEPEAQQSNELSKLLKLENVINLGYIEYKKLPSALSLMNFGILPIKKNNYTRSMSPMKYNEFLSAGLPVFYSSNIEVHKTHFSFSYRNEFELKKLISSQISNKYKKIPINTRRKMLNKFTWEKRLRFYLDAINNIGNSKISIKKKYSKAFKSKSKSFLN